MRAEVSRPADQPVADAEGATGLQKMQEQKHVSQPGPGAESGGRVAHRQSAECRDAGQELS